MDLPLYLRVFWRFRFLVLAGLILASVLAFLTYAKVSFESGLGSPEVEYREAEIWQSNSLLLITEAGFPWGVRSPEAGVEDADTNLTRRFADPTRFASLAVLYAQFATSDAVRKLILAGGPPRGTYTVAPVTDGRNTLPMVTVSGSAASPHDAVDTAARATTALKTYIRRQQRANDIPVEQRVELSTLRRPGLPVLVADRSKQRPIIVFLTIMMAVLGLAFILENLRPRRALRPSAAVTELETAQSPEAVRAPRSA